MSMRPNLSSPALTTRELSSALVRSAWTVTTGVPVVLVISSQVALSDLPSRAHNTNPAPSAASSSATARPRPLLDSAMRAILSLSPKSIGHISDWLYRSQFFFATRPLLEDFENGGIVTWSSKSQGCLTFEDSHPSYPASLASAG